jgi:hypothetical protein
MKPYLCAVCDEYRSADESPPTMRECDHELVCEACSEGGAQ